MNINDYILSGVVESYVLGLAEGDEREEFERMCALYPQVAEARDAFEQSLERHLLTGAKQPPQHVHARLLSTIKKPPVLHLADAPGINGHTQATPKRKAGMLTYLAAASAVALLCCGYFLYRLQVQNNNLAQTNKQLQDKFNHTDSTLGRLANEQSLATNKGIAVVHLTGAATAIKPQANIYWDSASAAVYLVVNGLPALPAGKQYQLWAQIDGKPKSLGVFDANSDKVILKMNSTKKADAFAITIEPTGGNAAPSGDTQAAGKAKGL